jgi:plastocyanin
MLGALMGAAACGGGGNGSALTTAPTPTGNTPVVTTTVATNSVTATTSDTFTPANISVSVGATVSFTFQSVGHNVTFDAVTGAPPSITGTNANTTLSVTFNTAGTFPYQCTIHPGMSGTVTVQ